jgi:hypothetical protein
MKALHVPKWYLVVIGAVAVQRLGELAISRSNEAGIRVWGSETPSSSIPDLSAAFWAHRSGRKDLAQVV